VDPITPFASAQHAATLLGDNAFLVEQLGFGHSSLAQVSSCTVGVVAAYIENSTVGVVYDGSVSLLIGLMAFYIASGWT
jgi:hypothetical protein